ncbi:MAG: hypothetical protein RIT45_3265 [Pseudomonadota bacterium]
MKTFRLPGTTLDATVVAHGCWAAGGLWWGDDVDDDASIAAMRAAYDAGVRLFDTAPLYGHGHADRLLARALGDRLSEVVVATKVGVRWDGDGAHAESDLSPDHVRADIDASLQRLGLQTLPLLQIHWPCQRGTPLEVTLEALFEQVRAGKVQAVGLCNYDAAQVRVAREAFPIVSLQTPYSMLRRELEGPLETAAHTPPPGLAVLAYEPLCRGLLTGSKSATTRYPDSDLRARDDRFVGKRYLRALTLTSRLTLLARRVGVPTAALALAWALRQPAVDIVIAGAKRAAQVAENVQAAALLESTAADEAFWAEVDRIAAAWHG